MAKKQTFNPVKEETLDQASQRVQWSTEAIQLAKEALEKGKRLKANPFLDGTNLHLSKPNLVFIRTKEEVEEWKKCREDPLYFCNTYAKLMTPKGIQSIVLRDYQEEYIKYCKKNRLTICLACRQAGKCNSLISNVLVRFTDKFKNDPVYISKKKNLSYYKNGDEFNLPLFELYNLFDSSISWKIKYYLYKLLYKIKK